MKFLISALTRGTRSFFSNYDGKAALVCRWFNWMRELIIKTAAPQITTHVTLTLTLARFEWTLSSTWKENPSHCISCINVFHVATISISNYGTRQYCIPEPLHCERDFILEITSDAHNTHTWWFRCGVAKCGLCLRLYIIYALKGYDDSLVQRIFRSITKSRAATPLRNLISYAFSLFLLLTPTYM